MICLMSPLIILGCTLVAVLAVIPYHLLIIVVLFQAFIHQCLTTKKVKHSAKQIENISKRQTELI